MGLFGKTRVEEKVEKLDTALKESFAKVRDDTDTIYQWLRHFHNLAEEQGQAVAEHEQTIHEHEATISDLRREIAVLRHEMSRFRLSPETVKRIIDEYYDFGTVLERIRNIEKRIEKLEGVRPARHSFAAEAPVQKQHFRDKIVQKITRNSKEYVKSIILNLINKYGEISALQLREMVVEEQGLVSRSSFYRLLEELEQEAGLQVVHAGKEKIYSAPNHKVRR